MKSLRHLIRKFKIHTTSWGQVPVFQWVFSRLLITTTAEKIQCYRKLNDDKSNRTALISCDDAICCAGCWQIREKRKNLNSLKFDIILLFSFILKSPFYLSPQISAKFIGLICDFKKIAIKMIINV